MASINSVVAPSSSSSTSSVVADKDGIPLFVDELAEIPGHYQEFTSADLENNKGPEHVQTLKTETQLKLNTAVYVECLVGPSPNLKGHVSDKERAGLTSVAVAVGNAHMEALPPEIQLQIFDNITDTKTLLSCRAVCRSWKTRIDATPSLMRRITFLVLDPSLYPHLTNILPSRIRSISFADQPPCAEEELQNLISALAPTLESVTFEFAAYTPAPKDDHERTAGSILRQCPQLNELRLLGKQKNFLQGMTFTEPVFDNITSLTINVVDEDDMVGSMFSKVVLSLSRLTILALSRNTRPRYGSSSSRYVEFHYYQNYVPVLTPVCEHMVKYPGVLKKLKYGQEDFWGRLNAASGALWTKLLLFAGRTGVVVTTDVPFNLFNLVVFEETEEHQVNLKNCSTITHGRLSRFWPDHVHHQHRIDLCVNIEAFQIWIEGNREIHQIRDQMSILWRLKKLRKLTWTVSPGCGAISEQIFSGRFALSTVQTLTFEGDAFDPTGNFFSSLYVYFPNLLHLGLYGTTVHQDLFVPLAMIERLASLKLMRIPSLLDIAFLPRDEFKNEIPAFQRLAKLRTLTISDCQNLTAISLQNGILLNPALETLTIFSCPNAVESEEITYGRFRKESIFEKDLKFGHSFTLNY